MAMDAGISFERSAFSESLMGKADKPCVMSYAFSTHPWWATFADSSFSPGFR
jgi:hypothetical protein